MQGILPYGAQLLYASAGTGVAALEIVPYMFYCYLMAVCAIVFILFLIPGLPKDVFTYLVPLTDMRMRTFCCSPTWGAFRASWCPPTPPTGWLTDALWKARSSSRWRPSSPCWASFFASAS